MGHIILTFLFLFSALLDLSAQTDSTDLIIGNWWAHGYGNKRININDTVLFKKDSIQCKEKDCDFVKWNFKSNGDFIGEAHHNITTPDGKRGRHLGTRESKWGVIKKTCELILSQYEKTARYKILSINKSELKIKRTK